MNTEVAEPDQVEEKPDDQLNQVDDQADDTVVEEVVETPLSEAEDMLAKISNAELDCREKEAHVENCKEDLKCAKASYDVAVSRLRKLASQQANDENRPLLKQLDSDSEDTSKGWEAEKISVLWSDDPISGFGDSKREALEDQVATLGAFEKLRSDVGKEADHLSKLLPKGIGESLADELENRHLDFVAKYSPEDAFDIGDYMNSLTAEDGWMIDLETDDDFEAGVGFFDSNNGTDDIKEEALGRYPVGSNELEQWCLGYCLAAMEWAENDGNVDEL